MVRTKPTPTPFHDRDAVTVATLGARAWRNDRSSPRRGQLDLSPDGRHLAVTQGNGVALLDVDTGLVETTNRRDTGYPCALRFAHRDPELFVVGAGVVVRLDPATLEARSFAPVKLHAHLCA